MTFNKKSSSGASIFCMERPGKSYSTQFEGSRKKLWAEGWTVAEAVLSAAAAGKKGK